jgi:dienelactone hydrolase
LNQSKPLEHNGIQPTSEVLHHWCHPRRISQGRDEENWQQYARTFAKHQIHVKCQTYISAFAVDTYFAYPESKQTEIAILLLTDVIGYNFINAQLIADQFAANGYYVVVPDLFEGDPIRLNNPPGFDFMEWLKSSGPSGGHGPAQTDPIVEAVIKDMKTNQGVKKIGAVGYCFGAKYVARFMTGGKGVDVGYMAHPSFVDVEEIKALTGPLSISAAGKEMLQNKVTFNLC